MIYAERYPSKFSLEILTTIFFLVITFPYPKKEVGGGGGREVAFCLWFMSVNCFLLKCWRYWLP